MHTLHRVLRMKASEIIAVLAKEITEHGDKRILLNIGEGIWYEPVIKEAGELFSERVEKTPNFMCLDMDLI